MHRRYPILLILFSFAAFVSCAPKKLPPKAAPGPTVQSERPKESKRWIESEDELESGPKVPKYFYSDIELVDQTSPEGNCPDEKRIQQKVEGGNLVTLDPNGLLKVTDPKGSFKSFVLNVNMQTMGFDISKFSFTSLDGQIPKPIPFLVSFRRRPGNIVLMKFLDQEISLKPYSTPVYTFSAVETRDACKIDHNVNVFLDHTGYYPLAH